MTELLVGTRKGLFVLEGEPGAEFEPAVRTSDLARQPSSPGLGRLGFAAADLTPDVARSLGLAADRGVVISQIDPAGAAYRARLRTGYVLEQFNGRRIASIAELRDATAGLRALRTDHAGSTFLAPPQTSSRNA